ncbi:aldolase catalytic domain-containing protein [bacterium]|nr:aldolase catalytic domain-containing protein [bacterium]
MGIKVLDCTLRDGSYVVDSKFGKEHIKNIIASLSCAGVDIIECGWLRDVIHNQNSAFFNSPDELSEYLPSKHAEYALMFDYGRYDISKLPPNNSLIDIVRIAFYKKSLDEISFAVESVKSKGYKVFLQPSNVKEYSESELRKLCSRANFLGVDSVYVVDSFGSMFPEDLDSIIPIFDSEVNKNIGIGFHSHNSIQLSFALTIKFIKEMSHRDISADASLCGIGRGAGNTKTELLLEYLNRNNSKYDMEMIKSAIDKNILPLYKEYNWEYTPERGYRGIKGLHPNTVV